ncbi:MAG TPA: hypothetical protein VF584_07780 [Longimicrobium sp.]|jgi:predicted RNase H-like HicB family nuclease
MWTVHGRAVQESAEDEPYYLVTIEELEGFSVVAESRAEALFPVVLKEYFVAAVESGNAPAIPSVRA